MATGLLLSFLLTVALVVLLAPGRALTEPDVARTGTGSPVGSYRPERPNTDAGRNGLAARSLQVSGSVSARYHGHTAQEWAAAFRWRTHQLIRARAVARRVWRPTVDYALRLANAVYGVPLGELRAVSHCESTWNPFAQNGRYRGLFQLGWVPFGAFDPFDPVANALSAAATVRHDGGWRQWECRP